MEAPPDIPQPVPAPAVLKSCWKEIGVWGDSSCPQLKPISHCRNCAVFSAAASKLLDIDIPADYLDRWTEHYAAPKVERDPTAIGVVLFRLGAEWFGLKSETLEEITEFRPIHSLPHGPDAVLGLINIRGVLRIAVALSNILGLEAVTFSSHSKNRSNFAPAEQKTERILVVTHQCKPLAFPVSEVGGIHRFGLHQLMTPPVTISIARNAFTTKVFAWQDRIAGLLDEELLFYTIHKKLS